MIKFIHIVGAEQFEKEIAEAQAQGFQPVLNTHKIITNRSGDIVHYIFMYDGKGDKPYILNKESRLERIGD